MNKNDLLNLLIDTNEFAEFKNLRHYTVYLAGGSACILGNYIERSTIDVDILDIGYPSNFITIRKMLGDTDVLDLYFTSIAHGFESRARLEMEMSHLTVYTLSPEDIVTSKIGRYSEKDIEDIQSLIYYCDLRHLLNLCDEVLRREDLSEQVRIHFINNLQLFRRDFNV